ncbi:MAG: protein-L-isoaspartate(D-aspartate) O-methyltransferase [Rhodospirillaceae bacterium]|jgi:protein-L-isoaspartate(D-aspartate) O-methyltransferase|nr:protein-L-isoaspartate(D-aspartate) O-methyltransferase [Rhodospirillaceae bacterium]MBT7771073.1 protein-L-isoaspartate(D-aspartate) O-methyltransferase [Rhodospirillales bacterium]MBT4701968.1 protein-L-isoaspartate(D-aspartate) O-methyltransferase [Rhodospirillaceae bacterium]MBT5036032.1 protein-L-isoaspartate(D-aspartate) O-methyltransferase [Rhodospirillaceae bacterium]MBT6220584.1 protein-L-isoaspartate(D-aspartate) O-methyltransferase [Rhodospirillaceae bacterium]
MTGESGKARLVLDLRQAGVSDARVMAAMEAVPRELFVPEPLRSNAYDDTALPIGYHQTVSQPTVVALMTEALNVGERMKVLEIGTGSGYQAAVLSKLCRRLYTFERHRPLLKEAEARFAELRITNITSLAADGSKGWPEQAPFDRIIVTAFAADIPPVLVEQLAVGGLMIVPVGDGDHDQRLELVERTEDGIKTKDLGAVRFVPMLEGMGTN